jgi:hypothetical protein
MRIYKKEEVYLNRTSTVRANVRNILQELNKGAGLLIFR